MRPDIHVDLTALGDAPALEGNAEAARAVLRLLVALAAVGERSCRIPDPTGLPPQAAGGNGEGLAAS